MNEQETDPFYIRVKAIIKELEQAGKFNGNYHGAVEYIAKYTPTTDINSIVGHIGLLMEFQGFTRDNWMLTKYYPISRRTLLIARVDLLSGQWCVYSMTVDGVKHSEEWTAWQRTETKTPEWLGNAANENVFHIPHFFKWRS